MLYVQPGIKVRECLHPKMHEKGVDEKGVDGKGRINKGRMKKG